MSVISIFFLLLGLFAHFDGLLASTLIEFRADHMILDSVTDGRLVYAATQDGRINRFDLKHHKKISSLIEIPAEGEENFPPPIFSLDLSPTQKVLVSGDALGRILFFSTTSTKTIKKITLPGIENIPVVRFISESTVLVGLLNGAVILIDYPINKQIYKTKVEFDPLNGIRLSPSHQLAAITSTASIIKVLELKTGKIIHELDAHRDTVYAAAFVGEDKLVSGSKDKKLLLWNLNSERSKLLYTSDFYINSVAWNGKNVIAFHLPNYKIGIYDLSSRRLEKQLSGHTAFINTLYFITPDKLMSSGNDARVLIRSITGRKQ